MQGNMTDGFGTEWRNLLEIVPIRIPVASVVSVAMVGDRVTSISGVKRIVFFQVSLLGIEYRTRAYESFTINLKLLL